MRRSQRLVPLEDRGPLRIMFLITSMPVGSAETLLANLLRRMDRDRFLALLCCIFWGGTFNSRDCFAITWRSAE